MKLSTPQAELLQAMRAGAVCHYMRYMGTFNPTPYYFRTDTMKPCTKQARALLTRGLVEEFERGAYGNHKLRAIKEPQQ